MPINSRALHDGLSATFDDAELREIFTFEFLDANRHFDRLVTAACESLLRGTGGFPGPDGTSPEAAAAALSLPARALPAFRFLFAKLADAGVLEQRDGRYLPTGQTSGDPGTWADVLSATHPRAAVGAEVIRLLVDEGGAFFRGEKTGEEILFAPTRLPLWFRYFSNENVLYGANNTLGAVALARALPHGGLSVLEVGGGCGSAAEAALRRLGAGVARYRFTEIVPTFARRGERAARAAASAATAVEAGRLDMSSPWEPQGVAPGSFDAVFSVNCFHVAHDLGFVLREAHRALKPGGAVVVSECVRPSRDARPIYVELVFDFLESFTDVVTDPVLRPTHGFLTPAAWRASFADAGFREVAAVPDVDLLAESYPDFFVGALIARK